MMKICIGLRIFAAIWSTRRFVTSWALFVSWRNNYVLILNLFELSHYNIIIFLLLLLNIFQIWNSYSYKKILLKFLDFFANFKLLNAAQTVILIKLYECTVKCPIKPWLVSTFLVIYEISYKKNVNFEQVCIWCSTVLQ